MTSRQERSRVRGRSATEPRSLPLVVALFALLAALSLGGGTRQGLMSDAVLQLLFVPVVLYASITFGATGVRRMPGVVLFVLALAALPLVQLIPLPRGLLSQNGLRDLIADVLTDAGCNSNFATITIAPEMTLQAALSLLVPIGLFSCVAQLSLVQRRIVIILLVTFGVGSALLGLLQVAQGPHSALRFYEVTNATEAVGFFANRNHFAALLFVALIFVVVLLAGAAHVLIGAPHRDRWSGRVLVPIVALVGALFILVFGLLMARSRAGLILGAIAVVVAAGFSTRGMAEKGWRLGRFLVLGAIVVALASSQYMLARVIDRLTDDPLRDARIVFAQRTWAAARELFPLGSGMGTFVPTYGYFERPADALIDTFANRAHNDFLEIFLEAGAVGLLLVGLYLTWLLWQMWRLRREQPVALGVDVVDLHIRRGCALSCLLLIAHSALDYPLRTSALMAILAVMSAMLVRPPQHVSASRGAAPRPSPPAFEEADPEPLRAPSELNPQRSGEWAKDLNWPDEWIRK